MKLKLFLATIGIFAAAQASAHSVTGLWDATFFLEPDLRKGATQQICIKPDRTWYSLTYPGWHGAYLLKGDRLRISGISRDYGTGMFGGLASYSIATGEYESVVLKSGRLSVNANWNLARKSDVCPDPSAPARATIPGPASDPAIQ